MHTCPLPLTGLAAGFTHVLGVDAPRGADAPLPVFEQCFVGKNIDRVVIYNPDAVALWLFVKYTELFADVQKNTQLTLPLHTVMPSVTPVCFASMYTGAMPEVHGIRAYVKPVVTTDSVYDALLRAGKKPCIVSTGEDSMSKIFLQRGMDYFIVNTPDEANEKAAELIRADKYDFISVYNGNYDGTMHRFGPESPEALAALKHNVAAFAGLADVIRENSGKHTALLGFAPDHGCHEIDGGCGSHGLDMPEDMNIIHFYGVL